MYKLWRFSIKFFSEKKPSENFNRKEKLSPSLENPSEIGKNISKGRKSSVTDHNGRKLFGSKFRNEATNVKLMLPIHPMKSQYSDTFYHSLFLSFSLYHKYHLTRSHTLTHSHLQTYTHPCSGTQSRKHTHTLV